MKYEEEDRAVFGFERAFYTKKCNVCDKEITLRTQTDDDPEYYTYVFIICPNCNNDIAFDLPVN